MLPNSAVTTGYNNKVKDSKQFTVALTGDSLSTSFFGTPNPLQAVARMRSKPADGNWFLETSNSPGAVDSLFQRLGPTERMFVNFATPSAAVGEGSNHKNSAVKHYALKISDFERQMDSALAVRPFPNEFIVEIGANNVDWAMYIKEESEIVKPEYDLVADKDKVVPVYIKESLASFERKFAQEFDRVAYNTEVTSDYPVELIVLTIPLFDKFFPVLDTYDEDKRNLVYKVFPSFKPEFRATTVEFQNGMNERLASLTIAKNAEYQVAGRNVKVVLSTAIGKFPYASPGVLAPDGFHPSTLGHSILSRLFAEDLQGRSRLFPAQAP